MRKEAGGAGLESPKEHQPPSPTESKNPSATPTPAQHAGNTQKESEGEAIAKKQHSYTRRTSLPMLVRNKEDFLNIDTLIQSAAHAPESMLQQLGDEGGAASDDSLDASTDGRVRAHASVSGGVGPGACFAKDQHVSAFVGSSGDVQGADRSVKGALAPVHESSSSFSSSSAFSSNDSTEGIPMNGGGSDSSNVSSLLPKPIPYPSLPDMNVLIDDGMHSLHSVFGRSNAKSEASTHGSAAWKPAVNAPADAPSLSAPQSKMPFHHLLNISSVTKPHQDDITFIPSPSLPASSHHTTSTGAGTSAHAHTENSGNTAGACHPPPAPSIPQAHHVCPDCELETRAATLSLVPFRQILQHILLQTCSCSFDRRWELRRMADQVLPVLIQVICWFDLAFFKKIWMRYLSSNSSFLQCVATLSIKYVLRTTHELGRSIGIKDPSFSASASASASAGTSTAAAAAAHSTPNKHGNGHGISVQIGSSSSNSSQNNIGGGGGNAQTHINSYKRRSIKKIIDSVEELLPRIMPRVYRLCMSSRSDRQVTLSTEIIILALAHFSDSLPSGHHYHYINAIISRFARMQSIAHGSSTAMISPPSSSPVSSPKPTAASSISSSSSSQEEPFSISATPLTESASSSTLSHLLSSSSSPSALNTDSSSSSNGDNTKECNGNTSKNKENANVDIQGTSKETSPKTMFNGAPTSLRDLQRIFSRYARAQAADNVTLCMQRVRRVEQWLIACTHPLFLHILPHCDYSQLIQLAPFLVDGAYRFVADEDIRHSLLKALEVIMTRIASPLAENRGANTDRSGGDKGKGSSNDASAADPSQVLKQPKHEEWLGLQMADVLVRKLTAMFKLVENSADIKLILNALECLCVMVSDCRYLPAIFHSFAYKIIKKNGGKRLALPPALHAYKMQLAVVSSSSTSVSSASPSVAANGVFLFAHSHTPVTESPVSTSGYDSDPSTLASAESKTMSRSTGACTEMSLSAGATVAVSASPSPPSVSPSPSPSPPSGSPAKADKADEDDESDWDETDDDDDDDGSDWDDSDGEEEEQFVYNTPADKIARELGVFVLSLQHAFSPHTCTQSTCCRKDTSAIAATYDNSVHINVSGMNGHSKRGEAGGDGIDNTRASTESPNDYSLTVGVDGNDDVCGVFPPSLAKGCLMCELQKTPAVVQESIVYALSRASSV